MSHGTAFAHSDGTPEGSPGRVELLRILQGHQGWINRIAWSPDGTMLASACNDKTIRIWDWHAIWTSDVETFDKARVLEGHTDNVIAVAWSPDGGTLASGSWDRTVRLWNPLTGRQLRILTGPSDTVNGVSWSPDGRALACGSADRKIHVWNGQTGKLEAAFEAHSTNVFAVAWAPTGTLASGAADFLIRLWRTTDWQVNAELRGHAGYILTLAWSPDGRILASGSTDLTIRLWDIATKRNTHVLEGHTGHVRSVCFSPDGRLLASKAADGTVRIWRCDTWQGIEVIEEPHSEAWLVGLDFHPSKSFIATLGNNETAIRLWRLNIANLLESSPTISDVRRKTAKVVVVGESGVGKTGLGWRLAYDEFKEHPSSHGQQFWVLNNLRQTESDGVECEAVLWDLAGQPDYRLIHALFLDDADLALVLFNPCDIHEPLRGVEFWLKTLSCHRKQPCRTILVGARLDVGYPTIKEDEIYKFCAARGITGGYVATSAKSGMGVDELGRRIKQELPWDSMAATTTPLVFDRIKNLVLGLKASEARMHVLIDATTLAQRVRASTEDDVLVASKHLAKHGYVHELRTAEGALLFLLTPELLNNLAASFILEARRNPKGLGALDETLLLADGYPFPELADLSYIDRRTLIDAARILFLEHNICFRETFGQSTYLVFPELINLRKPRVDMVETTDDSSYSVSGAVQNIYATLVVLLGYTNTFTRTDQWQGEAHYEVGPGRICGFRQLPQHDGDLDFVLYYTPSVTQAERLLFQGLFECILLARSGVRVTRYASRECHQCKYQQAREEVVRRTREGRLALHCSNCGTLLDLSAARQVISTTDEEHDRVERDRRVSILRTKFEMALVQVKALVSARAKKEKAPSCFISYAWGEYEQEQWVVRLANDLANAGLDVILDRWENAEIGANIARFVSRIKEADEVIVVGTPDYKQKCLNPYGAVVAAELDLIHQRLLGTEEQKRTVRPVLLKGDDEDSFPPLMVRRVYADFRRDEHYFTTLFDMIVTLFALPFRSPAVSELRESLRGGNYPLSHSRPYRDERLQPES